MSTINKILIAFIAILSAHNVVYATDYNYLPADVLIKQQEEKSALEYRLRTLESQVGGSNPSIQISNINYRIQELENEKETEKNYISGLYGSYGIGNQLSSKLSEIDTKYSGLISQLESQKDYYQNQIDEQEKIDNEIKKINKQLKEIDAYYDKQREAVIEQYNQKLQDINNVYSNVSEPTYEEAYKEFLRLDSLSTMELSSAEWQRLNSTNPKLAEMVKDIYNKTYPNGKEEQSESSVPNTKTTVKSDVSSVSETPYEAQNGISSTTTIVNDILSVNNEKTQEIPQENFVQKVFNFFKKLAFWK